MEKIFELITKYCFEPNKKNFIEAVNELRKSTLFSQEKDKLINLLYMRKSSYFDFVENIKWYFNTGNIDRAFLGAFFISFFSLEKQHSFTQEIYLSFQWFREDIDKITDEKLKLKLNDIINNIIIPDLPFKEEHDFSKRWRKMNNLRKFISPSEIIDLYQSLIIDYENKIIYDDQIKYQYLNLIVSFAQFLFQNNQSDECTNLIHKANKIAEKFFSIAEIKDEQFSEIESNIRIYIQNKSHIIHEIAQIYQLEGRIFQKKKDSKKAISKFTIANLLWKALFNDHENIFDLLTEYGNTNWLLIKLNKIDNPNFSNLSLFEETTNIYQSLIDLGDINSLYCHKRLGESLYLQANAKISTEADLDSINQHLFNALDEYIEALELTIGQSDDIRLKIVDICFTIGINFCEQSQLLEALDTFLQGTQYINDTNNEILQEKSLILHLEYARVLYNIRDNSQALNVLLQTLTQIDEFDLNYPENNIAILIKFSTLELLSRTLIALGNLHEALSYIEDMFTIEKTVLRATETLLANITRNPSLYFEIIAARTGTAFIFLSEYQMFNDDYSTSKIYLEIPNKLIESDINFKLNNFIDLFPALFYKNVFTEDTHKKKKNEKQLKKYLKSLKNNYNAIYERESFLLKIINLTTNVLIGTLLEEENASTSSSIFIEKAITIDEDVSRQIGFLYTFLYPNDFHWMASFSLARNYLIKSNLLQAQYHLNKIDELWESNAETRDLISPFITKQISILRKNIAMQLWKNKKYYDALETLRNAKSSFLKIIDNFSTELMPNKIVTLEIEVIKQDFQEVEWLIKLGETKESTNLIKKILPRLIKIPDSNHSTEIKNMHVELLTKLFSTYIFENNKKGALSTIRKIDTIIEMKKEIIKPINKIMTNIWKNAIFKDLNSEIILEQFNSEKKELLEEKSLNVLSVLNEILNQNKDHTSASKKLFIQEFDLIVNSMKYSASISNFSRITTLIERIKVYNWKKNQNEKFIEKLDSFSNNINLNIESDTENEELWKNLLYIIEAEIIFLMFRNDIQPNAILEKIELIASHLEKIKFLKIELNLLVLKTILSREIEDYYTAITSISEAIELTHGLRLIYTDHKILENLNYEDLGYILLLLQFEQWKSSKNPQMKSTGKIIQLGEYITNINILWNIERANLRPSINNIKNKFLEKISQREIYTAEKDEILSDVKIFKQNQKSAIKNLIRQWKKPIKFKIKEFSLIKGKNLLFIFKIEFLDKILTYIISDGNIVDIRTVENINELVSVFNEYLSENSVLITNNFLYEELERFLNIIDKEKKVISQIVVNYSYIIRSFNELEKEKNSLSVYFPKELDIFRLTPKKEIKSEITGYFISSLELNEKLSSSIISIGTLNISILELSKRLSKFGVTKLDSIALIKRSSIEKTILYRKDFDLLDIIQYLMYLGFYAIIIYDDFVRKKGISEKSSLSNLLKLLKNPQIFGYLPF